MDFALINQVAWAAVKEAVIAQHWPLFFCGNCGTGKSCTAAALFCIWPSTALWFAADELLCQAAEYRSNANNDGFKTLKRKVESAGLLVLDDLGLRVPSEPQFAVLHHIVSARRGRPTVITTNHGPEGFAQVFDDRIASRLLCGTIITFSGNDRRMERTRYVEA